MFTVHAGSEKELCEKIADVIIENPDHPILTVFCGTTFIVGVNVYHNNRNYFIYTVVIFDTHNRYICEYYNGKISVK